MWIAPSLLAANPGRYGDEASRAERSGADWLHLDIMDGHFVPNISFGPDVVGAAKRNTKLFLDVHLMCSRPEILLEPFHKAGAGQLTVHVELVEKIQDLLWRIRALGCKVGLAVNPPTSMDLARPWLDKIDTLLIMTVNPGFGGQPFISETLPKIVQAHTWRKDLGLDYQIEVDGGIVYQTAADCALAGADTFVSGTGLFRQANMKAAVTKMRRLVTGASSSISR